MAYEDYTVNQFKNAWFKGDRTVMTEEIFNTVYSEYINTSGLYDSEEFNRVSYINYLHGRVNSIKLWIDLQKKFLLDFGIPFVNSFKFFEKFGYFLLWEEDEEKFIKSLDRIELMEKQYISKLEISIKELFDFRKVKEDNNEKPVTTATTRTSFIRTINSLGKLNYKIDGDKTSVEELSLMIKQQTEENENLNFKV